jgi:3-hydroxybutyryl-CoA dehydrogenase
VTPGRIDRRRPRTIDAMAHPIGRVFVAGAGLMGHGIAQVHAALGLAVVLYEPELARAEAGRDRIASNLDRAVAKGKLTTAERDAIVARIEPSANVVHVADADLVIEAVFEDIKVKTSLWRELDVIAPEPAVFASNTSSIAIHRLAEAVSRERRERFAGMHFFSPVPVMPLIELIRGRDTSDETMTTFRDLATALGKQVIVSADRPGFIVNRILMPFLAEAMRAFEEGVGTADDIDAGARIGLNHPMGPLELADFIGLDVCLGIMRVLDDGVGNDHFRPPQVLVELVAAGKLGQKSGEGFHTYPRPAPPSTAGPAGG